MTIDATTTSTVSRREQRQRHKAERWQRRVDKWEARRAGPPPPRRLHRAVITAVMMVGMLAILYLLLVGPPSPDAAGYDRAIRTAEQVRQAR